MLRQYVEPVDHEGQAQAHDSGSHCAGEGRHVDFAGRGEGCFCERLAGSNGDALGVERGGQFRRVRPGLQGPRAWSGLYCGERQQDKDGHRKLGHDVEDLVDGREEWRRRFGTFHEQAAKVGPGKCTDATDDTCRPSGVHFRRAVDRRQHARNVLVGSHDQDLGPGAERNKVGDIRQQVVLRS
uniref:(northern house mosquito) hypothetical protein n=1 Tax=Culex pipiens TaxID=7175 RepID=A0A8D8I522_CULPI